MRQIILDTETTGLDPKLGHRVIEVGCVEMIDRQLTGNNFHQYLNPDRTIEAEAIEVHGITNEFLEDKPRFEDITEDLIEYLKGAQLVIHNAAFDVGFLNHEFSLAGAIFGKVSDYCTVLDTLAMAREQYPGQRNSLDALCKRFDINNNHRTLHGALLDAEILADVYLSLTGGQVGLSLSMDQTGDLATKDSGPKDLSDLAQGLIQVAVSAEEVEAHQAYLAKMREEGVCLWPESDTIH